MTYVQETSQTIDTNKIKKRDHVVAKLKDMKLVVNCNTELIIELRKHLQGIYRKSEDVNINVNNTVLH